MGMLMGGAVTALTTAVAQGPGGLHLILLGFGLGFTLTVAAAWFAAPRSSLAGRILALVGSAFWFAGWVSPFLMGWILPIPLSVWAGLAAAIFAASAVAYGLRSSAAGGAFGLLLALGSAGSMLVLLEDPVFAPDHSYVPYAVAVIAAAIVAMTTIGIRKRSGSRRAPFATDGAATP